jgi:hypothetical protein
MTMTVTNYSLPGTYIGNATYDYLQPVPSPTPTPDPSPDTPSYNPGENGTQFSNMDLGLICGAAGIVTLLIVVITMYFCTKSSSGAQTDPYSRGPAEADDVIYSTDRNTLLREAREKILY